MNNIFINIKNEITNNTYRINDILSIDLHCPTIYVKSIPMNNIMPN